MFFRLTFLPSLRSPREYTNLALTAGGPSSMNPFMATGGPLSVSAGRLSFTFGFRVRAFACLLFGLNAALC